MVNGDAKGQAGAPKENGENDEMVSVSKPTVEFEGYEKTITSVVKVLEERDGHDDTGVSTLMEGIDDAIKKCRSLRQRLAKLHKKRQTSTGHYSIQSKSPSP